MESGRRILLLDATIQRERVTGVAIINEHLAAVAHEKLLVLYDSDSLRGLQQSTVKIKNCTWFNVNDRIAVTADARLAVCALGRTLKVPGMTMGYTVKVWELERRPQS